MTARGANGAAATTRRSNPEARQVKVLLDESVAIRRFEDDDLDAVIALWRACDLVMPYNPPVDDIASCRAPTRTGEDRRERPKKRLGRIKWARPAGCRVR